MDLSAFEISGNGAIFSGISLRRTITCYKCVFYAYDPLLDESPRTRDLEKHVCDSVVFKNTRKTAATAENPAANKFSFVTSRLRW